MASYPGEPGLAIRTDSSGTSAEWEAACGPLLTNGRRCPLQPCQTRHEAPHGARSRLRSQAWGVAANAARPKFTFKLAKWPFAFVKAGQLPPNAHQTSSACGLAVRPNLQLCQHVQEVVTRCRSAITTSAAMPVDGVTSGLQRQGGSRADYQDVLMQFSLKLQYMSVNSVFNLFKTIFFRQIFYTWFVCCLCVLSLFFSVTPAIQVSFPGLPLHASVTAGRWL